MWMFSKLHESCRRWARRKSSQGSPFRPNRHLTNALPSQAYMCLSPLYCTCTPLKCKARHATNLVVLFFFFLKAAKLAQNRLCWGEKGGKHWFCESESRSRHAGERLTLCLCSTQKATCQSCFCISSGYTVHCYFSGATLTMKLIQIVCSLSTGNTYYVLCFFKVTSIF